MIDGNTREFLNKLYYEDHYVIFEGEKYFLNGCQTKQNSDGSESVKLEVYNLTQHTTILSITKATATECIDSFQDAVIWNGKSFWEAELQMTWMDE